MEHDLQSLLLGCTYCCLVGRLDGLNLVVVWKNFAVFVFVYHFSRRFTSHAFGGEIQNAKKTASVD